MIDMQLLNGALLAVAVLIGAAIAFAVAMMAVARTNKPGRGPHGGTRHDPAPDPQPDADDVWPPFEDDAWPFADDAWPPFADDASEDTREDDRELVLR